MIVIDRPFDDRLMVMRSVRSVILRCGGGCRYEIVGVECL